MPISQCVGLQLFPGPLAYGAYDRTKAKWSCNCFQEYRAVSWSIVTIWVDELAAYV